MSTALADAIAALAARPTGVVMRRGTAVDGSTVQVAGGAVVQVGAWTAAPVAGQPVLLLSTPEGSLVGMPLGGAGGGGGDYLPLAGGTMTGPLILAGPPSADMGAVNRSWITGDHARGSFPTTTVPSATITRPAWTGTVIGSGVSLSGTTWTVTRPGYWLLSMWGKFSANIASGLRMFGNWNIRNGNPYIRAQVGPGDSYVSATGLVYLYEGDQFIAEFYQNSGASMTVIGAGYIKWIGE
jgi:hypothetical protein